MIGGKMVKEKTSVTRKFSFLIFWVADGARTHDPQNHNLML